MTEVLVAWSLLILSLSVLLEIFYRQREMEKRRSQRRNSY